jgi:hypothetical protein
MKLPILLQGAADVLCCSCSGRYSFLSSPIILTLPELSLDNRLYSQESLVHYASSRSAIITTGIETWHPNGIFDMLTQLFFHSDGQD